MLAGVAPEPGEVADPCVGEDDPRARIAPGEVQRVAPERRDPAARVHDHGHAPLIGDSEDRLRLGLLEPELLGARMELDAASAGIEAALGLARWSFGVRIEAAERH